MRATITIRQLWFWLSIWLAMDLLLGPLFVKLEWTTTDDLAHWLRADLYIGFFVAGAWLFSKSVPAPDENS